MHNKIASIILNSAKASGLSDVFVAQPDAVKESLAGKIFLLAEIGGKKSDGRKIFDFLIFALTDNYYNDEKILFRDRIEGLKLENIFEAAIAKTNKDLLDFLADQKIRINPETTSITLGVIFENKLHFANFGRNRALLIYRHGENFELINVEANAAEVETETDASAPKAPQLFSSVISGEVPIGSYFIFASEALPEYVSGQDMISIVTKLPPMTAAEQIKNVLSKINTYVPFLGIIIKNTAGLAQVDLHDAAYDNSSAQSSISSLNYTEQKTEQMLAPAGLINFSKAFKKARKTLSGWLVPDIPQRRPAKRLRTEPADKSAHQDEVPVVHPSQEIDLGQVKSLSSIRANSFQIKEKIFFKKKSGALTGWLKSLGGAIGQSVNPRRWPAATKAAKGWFASLNLRNRWLFSVLGLLVLVFVLNMTYGSWHRQKAEIREQYAAAVTELESKEDQIDSYLLYNDEASANRVLLEAQALLNSLPRDNAEEQSDYDRLAERLQASEDKVQRITRIDQAAQSNDLQGLNIRHLASANGKLYAISADTIYQIVPNSSSSTKSSVAGTDLSRPSVSGNMINLLSDNQLIQFDAAKGSPISRSFSSPDQLNDTTGARVYNNNFYTIHKPSNQIFRFTRSGANYSSRSNWLADNANLSGATDLAIDGAIYVLNEDGQVMKFNLGKPVEYSSVAISPVISGATGLSATDSRLYFMDTATKRLIVLDKANGRLLAQYQVDSLSNPSSYAVNEASKKAYFLAGDQVYEISLN